MNVSLLDVGGLFPTPPLLSGLMFMIPPGPPIDVAPPGTSLVFPGTPSAPVVPTAVLVSDAAGGDLFRSGLVLLPPSPSVATLVTGIGSIPAASLPALTASLAGTTVDLKPSDGLKLGLGLLAFGLGPPETATINTVTIVPGAGTLAISITATVEYRIMFFVPMKATLTYATTLTLAPSGDARTPGRVLRVTAGGSTVAIGGGLSPIGSAIAAMFDGEVGTRIEGLLNPMLIRTAESALTGRGSMRTPTSVISARRVVITPSGMAIQIGIADFRMPVVTIPADTHLKVSISPAPVAGAAQSYAVHVLSAGAPVAGAAVTLTNYPSRSSANATTAHLPATDAQGNTAFTATLRAFHHDATNHGGSTVERFPFLTASAAGFTAGKLDLPLDSGV